MTYRAGRRRRAASALAVAICLIVCAFAAAGSASAATQHWAGASQVSFGSSQAFTAESPGAFKIHWEDGSVAVDLGCSGTSTSGTVENPSGGGKGTIASSAY